MAVGVFGKLPARRDYVQHGVDGRLMGLLDPWLQRCMQESRRQLGQGWLDAWLRAPIWRFWLGDSIAGTTVLGAMMPSVDGVGRYFPLCVLGAFDAPVAPPEQDEQFTWFECVEALMLDALSETGTYEALLSGLSALPAPAATRSPSGAEGGGEDVAALFAAIRGGMAGEFYDRYSCWWVPSAEPGMPARALIRRGLPGPEEYAFLIEPAGRGELAPAMGEG